MNCFIFASALAIGLLTGTTLRAEAPNLLPNGNFKKGMEGWTTHVAKEAEGECKITSEGPSDGDLALKVQVITAGPKLWDVNMQLVGLSFVKDRSYRIRFAARMEPGTAPLGLEIQNADGTGKRSMAPAKTFTIREDWDEYEYEFIAESSSPKALIYFANMNRPETTFWIANVSLTAE